MNASGSRELSTAESSRLAELKAVVERGLVTFIEVGSALMEIRSAKLYRETHETFESFCVAEFGFSASRARQLIAAAKSVTEVTVFGLPAPTNEREAREQARAFRDWQRWLEDWEDVTGEAPMTLSEFRELVSTSPLIEGATLPAADVEVWEAAFNDYTLDVSGRLTLRGKVAPPPPSFWRAKRGRELAWDLMSEARAGEILIRLDLLGLSRRGRFSLDSSDVDVDGAREELQGAGLPDEWSDDDVRLWAVGWAYCQLRAA